MRWRAVAKPACATRIDDTVDASNERTITHASAGGELAMRYSLRDMRLIERAIDGVPYAAPMARAGALDGAGAQWAHSSGDALSVGDATAVTTGATSLIADRDAGRYVVIRTAPDAGPLRLTTPRTTIECAVFGFGRLELDERAGTLAIETDDPAGLTVNATAGLAVTVNGRPT